jgi:GNAT superfamily N-acetyltransferase
VAATRKRRRRGIDDASSLDPSRSVDGTTTEAVMHDYVALEAARHRAAELTARLVTTTIRGGTADLRPLDAGEVAPLAAVFAGLSPASRLDRYLTPVVRLTPSMVAALTAVDGTDHVAWLASVEGAPAGIGRFVRTAPDTAEVALEVVDAHQGRGLGAVLVDTVTTVAAAAGIRRVEATVGADNHASRRLVAAIGVRLRPDGPALSGTGPLRLMVPPRVDRAAVLGVFLGNQQAGAA